MTPEEAAFARMAKEEADKAALELNAAQASIDQMPEGDQKEAARKELKKSEADLQQKKDTAERLAKKRGPGQLNNKKKKNLLIPKRKPPAAVQLTAMQRKELEVPYSGLHQGRRKEDRHHARRCSFLSDCFSLVCTPCSFIVVRDIVSWCDTELHPAIFQRQKAAEDARIRAAKAAKGIDFSDAKSRLRRSPHRFPTSEYLCHLY